MDAAVMSGNLLRPARRSFARRRPGAKTVAVIGGGFSGSLFALKLSAARPDWTVLLVEPKAVLGRGIAYGTHAAQHLLNVPAARMDLGQSPSFTDWLAARQDDMPETLADALAESGGVLADAFVPRRMFGDYLEEQVSRALMSGRSGLRRIRDTAVAIARPGRRLVLAGGRGIAVDIVVLATGNLPAATPVLARPSRRVVPDLWSPKALDRVEADAPVLIIGSGLTMVDTVLSLRARGHTGSIDVVSRHGLLPRRHAARGDGLEFTAMPASPREALRAMRTAIRDAQARGIPWQRVFDAARPGVAAIWMGWNTAQRGQFLRHLRTLWDVHRHRMPARIADTLQGLIDAGSLRIHAGRLEALVTPSDGVTAEVRLADGSARAISAAAVINCAGPQTDLRLASHPLLRALLADGLIRSDPLGLGLESEDSAVRHADSTVSDWLFALGPLTRPYHWEITAVPEIAAQIERLVGKLARTEQAAQAPAFLDFAAYI